jgi:hypothetical protein
MPLWRRSASWGLALCVRVERRRPWAPPGAGSTFCGSKCARARARGATALTALSLSHTHSPPPSTLQGRELSRDDLSSTVQILRYRHHLLGEQKTEAKHAAASPPRAATAPSATQVALAASQALRATAGLASVIPTFTNEFDRQRHVAEFSTRVLPPAVRSTRIHGSTRPISTDIGEGAFDKNLLKSPQYATLKPGQMSIVHATVGMLSPSMVA